VDVGGHQQMLNDCAIHYYKSVVKQAVTLLDDLLKTPTPHHFEHTMNTNQGLICNNVLHNRSAFVDD
jgi:hypothetical protein